MNEDKLKNLILYISAKLKDSPSYGSTVLNKVLYYIDNIHYLKTGNSITGLSYIKQVKGPTPKPSEFLQLRDEMVSEGELEIEDRDFFGLNQKKPIAKKNAELNLFSGNEVSLIDSIIELFESIDAKQASSISHGELAWELAESMENLPYYSFLLSEDELTDNDIKWVKNIEQKKYAVSNN